MVRVARALHVFATHVDLAGRGIYRTQGTIAVLSPAVKWIVDIENAYVVVLKRPISLGLHVYNK